MRRFAPLFMLSLLMLAAPIAVRADESEVAHCIALMGGATGDSAASAFSRAYFSLLPALLPVDSLEQLMVDPFAMQPWRDGVSAVNQGAAFGDLKRHLATLGRDEQNKIYETLRTELRARLDQLRGNLPGPMEAISQQQNIDRVRTFGYDPTSFDLSQNGEILFTRNFRRLDVFDARTGAKLRHILQKQLSDAESISNQAISPDRKWLMLEVRRTDRSWNIFRHPIGKVDLVLLDFKTVKIVKTFKLRGIPAGSVLQFSQDSQLIFWRDSGDIKQKPLIFNLSLEPLATGIDPQIILASTPTAQGIRFAVRRGGDRKYPSTLQKVLSSSAFAPESAAISVYEVEPKPAAALNLSPPRNFFKNLWSSLPIVGTPPIKASVRQIRRFKTMSHELSKDGTRYAVLKKDRVVIADVETGRKIAELPSDFAGSKMPASNFRFLNEENLFGAYDPNHLEVWDYRTGKQLLLKTFDRRLIRQVVASPDGRYLALLSMDASSQKSTALRELELWDLTTGEYFIIARDVDSIVMTNSNIFAQLKTEKGVYQVRAIPLSRVREVVRP